MTPTVSAGTQHDRHAQRTGRAAADVVDHRRLRRGHDGDVVHRVDPGLALHRVQLVLDPRDHLVLSCAHGLFASVRRYPAAASGSRSSWPTVRRCREAEATTRPGPRARRGSHPCEANFVTLPGPVTPLGDDPGGVDDVLGLRTQGIRVQRTRRGEEHQLGPREVHAVVAHGEKTERGGAHGARDERSASSAETRG